MSYCKCCLKETNNPKYCSKSCATRFNNKIPKRKLKNKCKVCSEFISSKRTYCDKCLNDALCKDMTLQEAIYEKHHKSSAFALVRSRARSTEKYKNTKCCEKCGYSKHVQACHIKPISSFPKNTLISKINEEKNIIILCPNCHWELDNNIWKL
jgi:hypothetical protein